MSNKLETTARREEEIAFLALERILLIDIIVADAGGGPSRPDGCWAYAKSGGIRGIVEVTSPPAETLMREWARAKKEGRLQVESGSVPLRLNELHLIVEEMLATPWAAKNVNKLQSHQGLETPFRECRLEDHRSAPALGAAAQPGLGAPGHR